MQYAKVFIDGGRKPITLEVISEDEEWVSGWEMAGDERGNRRHMIHRSAIERIKPLRMNNVYGSLEPDRG